MEEFFSILTITMWTVIIIQCYINYSNKVYNVVDAIFIVLGCLFISINLYVLIY
jgi:hypothetical protein